jgi:hypothetical protein
MKKWVLALLVVVALAVGGLLAVDYVGRYFEQGSFPVEVHIESKANHKIIRVSFGALVTNRSAEEVQKSNLDNLDLESVTDFDGKRGTVRVRYDACCSGLGRELDYGQEGLLILRFEFADGGKQCRVVEIPDGRRSRSVSVEID